MARHGTSSRRPAKEQPPADMRDDKTTITTADHNNIPPLPALATISVAQIVVVSEKTQLFSLDFLFFLFLFKGTLFSAHSFLESREGEVSRAKTTAGAMHAGKLLDCAYFN